MGNTYKQPGEMIDLAASGADIAVNSVQVVGKQLAVAAVTIADGQSGSAHACGVHELPKNGEAMAQGSSPVWDVSAGEFVADGTALDTGDVSGVVTVWEAAGAGDTTVRVKLNTGIGTVGA